MFNNIYNNIYTRQGDSLDFDVSIKQNNAEYTLAEGEKLWFVVKATPDATTPLIKVTQTSKHFSFDAITLSPETYYHEVGIILEDDKEVTLIPSEDHPHPKFIVSVREKGDA